MPQSEMSTISQRGGDFGATVITPYTKNWWLRRRRILEESLVLRAILEATSFTSQLGVGYNHLKILDINCGLGAFVHYMHDGGFPYIRGTDSCSTVRSQWDRKKLLTTAEPQDLPFEDKSFHIVKWTTVFDSRVPEKSWGDVLEEIRRVGNGAYIFSSISADEGDREKWLNRLLDHNIIVFRVDESANLLFAIEG